MSLRRGIEPIIATVILVAVALIIAVAVVGYLMGLFGGLTGGSPQISITNIALKKTNDRPTLEMYISNTGAGSDRLLKVEVIANGSVIASTTPSGGGSNVVTTINGNFKGWVTVTLTGDPGKVSNVSPGDTVIVKLYFEKSGTQIINAVVSA
jgi:flagellin-like protein